MTRHFLVLISLLLVSVELITRCCFDRISRVQRHITEEYYAVVHTGRESMRPKKSMVVLGNSLLEAGLEFEQLQQALSPQWEAKRLVIAQTSYFDWYYGLRRLFAEGARPDAVVLVLTATQVVASTIRGDYFAHYLMDSRDILRVARDLDLHPTVTSNLFFANISKFYGVRAEIRKRLLGVLMPDLPRLTTLLTQTTPAPLTEEQVYQTAVERLQSYKNLVTGCHAQPLLIVPPVLEARDHSATLQRAGMQVGVPVLVAIPAGALQTLDFRDGFHLSREGASKFTEKLIPLLYQEIVRAHKDSPATSPVLNEAREITVSGERVERPLYGTCTS